MTDTTDLIDALHDVLEAERAALREGALDKVARMAERKEALIVRIRAASPDPAALGPLQQALDRNRVLLSSAIDGLRAVGVRLNALSAARGRLETYDRAGRRQVSQTPGRSLERRA